MLVKLSKLYKGVTIEVSGEMSMESGKVRKNLAQQLLWAMEDIDEKFPTVSNDGRYDIVEFSVHDDEENEQEYLLITNGQKEYLRKLGVPESKIEKIKTKSEASALITKLAKGK